MHRRMFDPGRRTAVDRRRNDDRTAAAGSSLAVVGLAGAVATWSPTVAGTGVVVALLAVLVRGATRRTSSRYALSRSRRAKRGTRVGAERASGSDE